MEAIIALVFLVIGLVAGFTVGWIVWFKYELDPLMEESRVTLADVQQLHKEARALLLMAEAECASTNTSE